MGDVLSGSSNVEGLMHQLTNVQEDRWFTSRAFTTLVIALLLEVPLCLARTLAAQKLSSVIALVAPALTFMTMLWRIISSAVTEGIPEPRIWPDVSQPLGIISTLSVLFTAYQCHYNVHPTYKELKFRTKSRINTVISASVGSTTLLYILVAVGGALLFGASTQPDVLLNFSGSHVEDAIVKVSYLFALAFSFPVVFFTLRQTVSKLLLGVNEPSKVQSAVITILLVSSQAVLAVLARDIKIVLKLLGTLVASVLGYALPAACAARVEQSAALRSMAWCLFVFAAAVLVFGLIDQIPELLHNMLIPKQPAG